LARTAWVGVKVRRERGSKRLRPSRTALDEVSWGWWRGVVMGWESPWRRSQDAEGLWRDFIDQPDPVRRAGERHPPPARRPGIDEEDDGQAVAGADLLGGRCGRGQVDVVPPHALQAGLQDGLDGALGGAVVEDVGRGGGLELEIDLGGVPLVGADAGAG